jgi:addiction module HigA family antidote
MLLEGFLEPLGIPHSASAVRLGVSFPRLSESIRGKPAVTPDTALRLARVTGIGNLGWEYLMSPIRSTHDRGTRYLFPYFRRVKKQGIKYYVPN